MNCKRVVVVAVVAALALGACSSDKKTGSPTSPGGSTAGSFTIYTSGVFKDIIDRLVQIYTATHKATKITIVTKTPPNVLKAAYDAKHPSVIVLINQQSRVLGSDVKTAPLGQDRAVIAVTTTNPKKVADVKAFAPASGLKTSMCGVPTGFGNTAFWVMLRSKVKVDPKKVGAGCEAKSMQELTSNKIDAALVFRGRAHPPKGVKLLAIPDDQNIVFKLSFLPVGKTKAVAQFAAFLGGAGARQILTNNGYLP